MEKRGLGRGLAALISDTLEEGGEGQVREVPLDQVVANPYQPRTRFDSQKMEELAASIREHGVLQPVLLRRVGHERYELVAGERRFRAALSAGLKTLPALVKECTEREQLEMAVVENLQRQDIGAMEAARAYRRLIDEFGMTQEMVAQRVGKSRPSVTNTLRLLHLPEPIQESVARGEISESHAVAILMADAPETRLHLWQRIVKLGLSVREAERLAKETRPDLASPSRKTGGASEASRDPLRGGDTPGERRSALTDPNEAAVVDALQQVLKTKVSLRHSAGEAGKIEIEFYSSEDLERIVELLLPSRVAP
jgi:ParB family chromosome partitioning protein